MRLRGLFVVFVSALVVAAGCGDSPTRPSSAPYSQTELHIGSGLEASSGEVITVNYTGWLWDPTKIDGKGSSSIPQPMRDRFRSRSVRAT
jgi:peptidylprolyl isomerase